MRLSFESEFGLGFSFSLSFSLVELPQIYLVTNYCQLFRLSNEMNGNSLESTHHMRKEARRYQPEVKPTWKQVTRLLSLVCLCESLKQTSHEHLTFTCQKFNLNQFKVTILSLEQNDNCLFPTNSLLLFSFICFVCFIV